MTSPETGTGGAPAAQAVELRKVYGSGPTAVTALDGVSAAFPAGRVHRDHGPVRVRQVDLHALPGRPGHRRPRARCIVGGDRLSGMSDKRLTELRRDRVGFVFQQFNLLPTLTAEENITLPLEIAGRKPDQAWFDAVVDRGRPGATGCGTGRPSCPAASSSGSPAPGR